MDRRYCGLLLLEDVLVLVRHSEVTHTADSSFKTLKTTKYLIHTQSQVKTGHASILFGVVVQ